MRWLHIALIVLAIVLLPHWLPAQPLPTLIPYQAEGLWGYSDSDGNILIMPRFTYEAGLFTNGRARVADQFIENGQYRRIYSLIDEQGNYVIPPSRNWDGYWSDSIMRLNSFNADGKWGMIDTTNKLIIPYEYDETPYYNIDRMFPYGSLYSREWKCRFMFASKGGRMGVINRTNKVLIPFKYYRLFEPADSASLFYLGAQKEKDGPYGVIDSKDRIVIPFRYERIHYINYFAYPEGTFFPEVKRFHKEGFLVEQNYKKGWQDYPGNLIIDPLYDELTINPDSTVLVRKDLEPREDGTERDCNYTYGLIGKDGQFIIPIKWCLIAKERDSALCVRFRKSNGITTQYRVLINTRTGRQGKPEIVHYKSSLFELRTPKPFDQTQFEKEAVANRRRQNGRANDTFEIEGERYFVTSSIYRPSHPFEPYFIIRSLGVRPAYGIIDTGLQLIVKPQHKYHFVSASFDANYIIAMRDSMYGILDTALSIRIPFQRLRINELNMIEGRTYGRHNITHGGLTLIAANGRVPAFLKGLTIVSYLDEQWRECYRPTTTGNLLLADSLGRQGIKHISGRLLYPAVSFRHHFIEINEATDMILVSDDDKKTDQYLRKFMLVNEKDSALFPGVYIRQNMISLLPDTSLFKVGYYVGSNAYSNMFFYRSRSGRNYGYKVK